MAFTRPPTKRSGRSPPRKAGKPSFTKRGQDAGERRDRPRSERADTSTQDSRASYRSDASFRPKRRDAEPSKQSGAGRPERAERPATERNYRPDHGRDGSKAAPGFKSRRDKPDYAKPGYAKKNYSKAGRARPDRPHSRDRAVERPAPISLRDGAVLLWGQHAVREAWLNPKRRCFRLRGTASALEAFAATLTQAQDALLKRPDPGLVERAELDRITPPGSVHQGIVLEAAPLVEPALRDIIAIDRPPDLILMLDQVTDPHNVGAILRSAAAFGAGAVIMTERNAPGSTGVLAKSASGALEHVPMIHVVNLARALDELKQAGYWSVGLAEQATHNLAALDLTGRTVIVLGAEGEGLRHLIRQKCDELAKLPSGGPIGSLNVSNAAAIGLYEVRRQKNSTG